MHSSINSQIIDGSAPNYNQLNHIFRGFLDSGRWLPKPIATAREPLICQHILDLFAWPWTVSLMVLIRDLNFKLSNHTPPDKIGLAEGRTVLFETRSACSMSTFVWYKNFWSPKRNTLALDGKVDRLPISLRNKRNNSLPSLKISSL